MVVLKQYSYNSGRVIKWEEYGTWAKAKNALAYVKSTIAGNPSEGVINSLPTSFECYTAYGRYRYYLVEE